MALTLQTPNYRYVQSKHTPPERGLHIYTTWSEPAPPSRQAQAAARQRAPAGAHELPSGSLGREAEALSLENTALMNRFKGLILTKASLLYRFLLHNITRAINNHFQTSICTHAIISRQKKGRLAGLSAPSSASRSNSTSHAAAM